MIFIMIKNNSFTQSFRDTLILKGKLVLRELYHKISLLFELSFKDDSSLNSFKI